MKKFVLLMVVLGITLSLASPVYAAPQAFRGFGVFSLVGKIVELDPVSGEVKLDVLQGNRMVKAYVGMELIITTDASTRFLENDGITTTPIFFSDLTVDNQVSVMGKLVNGVWTATRITVDLKVPCP